MTNNITTLLNNALNDEALSPQGASLFNGNSGIQEEIQGALGVGANLFNAAEAILVTVMPDDSGSISAANNETIMIEGVNTVLDAVGAARVQDNILAHIRLLNGKIICPFVPLAEAERLSSRNYSANLGTPLYDSTVVLLGSVLMKAQEFKDAGIPVQTVTLIATDGLDEHSMTYRAADVKKIVTDMNRTEDHIVAAMGIDDGSGKFEDIFKKMGILPKWILTPSNSHGEIRRAFRMFSQSASAAARGSAAFSQTVLGGGFGV